MTRSVKTAYKPIKPILIPIHKNFGATGSSVAWAKNGNGTVSAIYRLSSVIRINGDRRKTDWGMLVDVTVTAVLSNEEKRSRSVRVAHTTEKQRTQRNQGQRGFMPFFLWNPALLNQSTKYQNNLSSSSSSYLCAFAPLRETNLYFIHQHLEAPYAKLESKLGGIS